MALQEIYTVIDQRLTNCRYYQIYDRHQLHLVGHMHDDFVCQSCVTRDYSQRDRSGS